MQNRIIFITGRKGCGKSTYALRFAEQAAGSHTLVIVDPMNCFGSLQLPDVRTRDELAAITRSGRRSFRVIPTVDESIVETVFEFCFHAQNLILIVDEVDLYLSHALPSPWLLKLIRYGRHQRVSLVAISQRPANVKRDLTAMADDVIVFAVTENRDLQYLSQRLSPTEINIVKRLPKFKHFRWSADGPPDAQSEQLKVDI